MSNDRNPGAREPDLEDQEDEQQSEDDVFVGDPPAGDGPIRLETGNKRSDEPEA